ncbi:ABC-type cobalamin/Fe3+-siderophores transport system ATPase subunit [Rhodococcus sp. BE178]
MTSMDDPYSPPAPPPAVLAEGLTRHGALGPVFGPVDLRIPFGGLAVIQGFAGSGRTSLLLTLGGRMKPSAGRLTVLGRTRPAAIRAVSAIAGFAGIDTISESVTVRDLITEQIRWDATWYRLIRRASRRELEQVCAPVFGDRPLPRLTDYVSDLDELDAMLLRIAVADTQVPPVLLIDDLEQVRDETERAVLVDRLAVLGARQTVIASAVNPLPPGSPAHEFHPLADTAATGNGSIPGSEE